MFAAMSMPPKVDDPEVPFDETLLAVDELFHHRWHDSGGGARCSKTKYA
jgi:hypothetical protein